MKVYASIIAALSAGPGLDEMSRVRIQTIAASLDSLQSSSNLRTEIQLSKWFWQSVPAVITKFISWSTEPFQGRGKWQISFLVRSWDEMILEHMKC